MKYIDADKLIANLERQNVDKKVIEPVIHIIDSLKQEQNSTQDVELTDFESALFTAFSYAWQSYLSGEEVDVVQWAKENSAELLEAARCQQEQQEVDLEKDVESWFFNEISSKINVEHTMYYYFQECARRYFERGKNNK